MRWNGVFILGLGLTALGFVAVSVIHAFGPVSPSAAALSVGILAGGALVACIGTLLNRPRSVQTNRRQRRSRLFGGPSSQNGTAGRIFGQRHAYGALPPVERRRKASEIEFKTPGQAKPKPAEPARVVRAIEGPR